FLVTRTFRDDLSTRRTEIALAVEFTDIPRLLAAHAIDGADKISIRHSMGGLFEFPKILAQSSDSRRRIEHDFRSVEAQSTRAFGKVAIVADVNADIGELRFEDRISEITGLEIKLF